MHVTPAKRAASQRRVACQSWFTAMVSGLSMMAQAAEPATLSDLIPGPSFRAGDLSKFPRISSLAGNEPASYGAGSRNLYGRAGLLSAKAMPTSLLWNCR
jgi:hypothetical protein